MKGGSKGHPYDLPLFHALSKIIWANMFLPFNGRASHKEKA